jgi:DNA topoisomerase-1
MMLAQQLYEGISLGRKGPVGLITYMRTDSTRISQLATEEARAFVVERYGTTYVPSKPNVYASGKNAQDAHEAIRPTNLDNDPEKIKAYLSNDQYKLYRFIYYRALASLMAEAVFSSVIYQFDNNGYEFIVNGTKQEFDGFLKVYGDYGKSKDVILPKLQKDEVISCSNVEKEQHFTEAPSRYTEAKLIKDLEEEGVGRPSTYATIIDTIVKRNYVEYKKASDSGKTKYFFPTEQGILTDEKLREFFQSVINVKYTAQMESELDEIAENKVDAIASLHDFYDRFQPLVDSAYEQMEKKAPEKTGETCPVCGGDVVIRNGRYGKFKSCINYPTCKWHESLVKKEEPGEVGRNCPQCGKPLLKRKSRYGTYFIGCSGYPSCNYLEAIEGQQPRKKYFRGKKK